MLQSGFPNNAWDFASQHTAMALNLTQRQPLLPGDYDAAGNLTDSGKAKRALTCWEAHHAGEAFPGVIQPLGRLCYFLEREKHPVEPTTSPGLFLGWRLESGLRFRDFYLWDTLRNQDQRV